MIECEVDMGYLLEWDEFDKVILIDENGEHEPMEFVPADATVGGGMTLDEATEYAEKFMGDYAKLLLESTLYVQCEPTDHHAFDIAEQREAQMARTLAEALATASVATCHMRLVYEEEDADGCIWPDHYECDACGAKVNGIMPFCDIEIPPKFCPNCGRKVVSR